MAYYGTIAGANAYFSNRLHSEAWLESPPSDWPVALSDATLIIDDLNYRGVKHAVWLIMYDQSGTNSPEPKILGCDSPDRDQVIAADQSQELEFPRGKDTIVPKEIEWACYETALALIEGFDPEDALDRANVIRQAYSAVRTTYTEGSAALEYLVYGIPTARVWRWLKPFLTDDRLIRFSRAD